MAYFERKDDYNYIRWAQEVKKRDFFTCTVCGARGVMLNSHHLNAWAHYPTLRYIVDNGTTLCNICHDKFHDIYGKGKNTEAEFEEFKSLVGTIIKVAKEESTIDFATRRMLQMAEKDVVIKKILEDLDGYR